MHGRQALKDDHVASDDDNEDDGLSDHGYDMNGNELAPYMDQLHVGNDERRVERLEKARDDVAAKKARAVTKASDVARKSAAAKRKVTVTEDADMAQRKKLALFRDVRALPHHRRVPTLTAPSQAFKGDDDPAMQALLNTHAEQVKSEAMDRADRIRRKDAATLRADLDRAERNARADEDRRREDEFHRERRAREERQDRKEEERREREEKESCARAERPLGSCTPW